MYIIENNTTLTLIEFVNFTDFKATFFTKIKDGLFEVVDFEKLEDIQKACIQVKIEEIETKNSAIWLKD